MRRALSLQTRLLWAASLALAAFLGATGYALDLAFKRSALQAMRDRMQSYVWAYLSGSDINVRGGLILPDIPPEPRFDRPQSGLYAGVVGPEIEWRSASALGRQLPFDLRLEPGRTQFDGPIETNVGGVYRFAQGVAWEMSSGDKEMRLTFFVAEHEAVLKRQITVYRRTLFAHLGTSALMLLLVQLLMLRWSLRPLRQVTSDLARVERGERDALPDRYPRELTPLTSSINDIIADEREQRLRYRNTLGDLAHSLKTPLAVIRGQLEQPDPDAATQGTIAEQVRRMDELVAYQLARAAASGHAPFAAPIEIEKHAEAIVSGLEKVYAGRGILCEFEIDPQARFYGETGDLLELLGNLLENAFKWAKGRVVLQATRIHPPGTRRPGLDLCVDDDGPGIPADKVEALLKRGVRGDERVQGHGIGLAIVQDIVRSYRGNLNVEPSPELGGARFHVRFEATR
ncbi:MAG: two-component sensor histidine kinase [Xanthomonadales bacterium]|nr:two-component sensor histidine kinase [Xanthomonadales bacterium]